MRSYALPLLFAAMVLASGSAVRAEDDLLRGPHPFNKENELVAHAGYSAGLGGSPHGLRVAGDYSLRLGQTLWLDIQMGIVTGDCDLHDTRCRKGSGTAVDVLAGSAWKFQTKLPVVPYAKLIGGPAFQFPDDTRSAFGLLLRGGAGAHYYLVDWFGVGVEFGATAGIAFYGGNGRSSGALGSFDATVGVAIQF